MAAAIVVFQLTGSAAMVAGVALSGYGTALVLAPVGGQLADRFDRRALLLVSHVSLALVTLLLSLLVALDRAGAWTILGFTAVVGVGRAVNSPAMAAMVPALIPRRDLAPALALHAVTFHLARAVGPLLGALLVAWAGPAAAFAVNAATFAVYALVLPIIRPVAATRSASASSSFLDGLRYLRRTAALGALIGLGAIAGMGSDPVITLGPSYAELFGRGEAYVGALVSSFGFGAILAAPFLARLRTAFGRVRTGITAMAGLAFGLLAMSVTPDPLSTLVAAFLAGFSFLVAATDLWTVVQELVDEDVRGRVMAVWSMGFLGSRPLAAGMNGAIADLASPRIAVAVLAGLIGLTAGAGVWWWRRIGGDRGLN